MRPRVRAVRSIIYLHRANIPRVRRKKKQHRNHFINISSPAAMNNTMDTSGTTQERMQCPTGCGFYGYVKFQKLRRWHLTQGILLGVTELPKRTGTAQSASRMFAHKMKRCQQRPPRQNLPGFQNRWQLPQLHLQAPRPQLRSLHQRNAKLKRTDRNACHANEKWEC